MVITMRLTHAGDGDGGAGVDDYDDSDDYYTGYDTTADACDDGMRWIFQPRRSRQERWAQRSAGGARSKLVVQLRTPVAAAAWAKLVNQLRTHGSRARPSKGKSPDKQTPIHSIAKPCHPDQA